MYQKQQESLILFNVIRSQLRRVVMWLFFILDEHGALASKCCLFILSFDPIWFESHDVTAIYFCGRLQFIFSPCDQIQRREKKAKSNIWWGLLYIRILIVSEFILLKRVNPTLSLRFIYRERTETVLFNREKAEEGMFFPIILMFLIFFN